MLHTYCSTVIRAVLIARLLKWTPKIVYMQIHITSRDGGPTREMMMGLIVGSSSRCIQSIQIRNDKSAVASIVKDGKVWERLDLSGIADLLSPGVFRVFCLAEWGWREGENCCPVSIKDPALWEWGWGEGCSIMVWLVNSPYKHAGDDSHSTKVCHWLHIESTDKPTQLISCSAIHTNQKEKIAGLLNKFTAIS